MTTIEVATQELLNPKKLSFNRILKAAAQEQGWEPKRIWDAVVRENNRIKRLAGCTTHIRRYPDGTETQFTNLEYSTTKIKKVVTGKAKLRGSAKVDATYLADAANTLSTTRNNCRSLIKVNFIHNILSFKPMIAVN